MIKPQPQHAPEDLARIERVPPGASSDTTAAWRGRFVFEPPSPKLPAAPAGRGNAIPLNTEDNMSEPTSSHDPNDDYPRAMIRIHVFAPWLIRARVAWFLCRTAGSLIVPFRWGRDPDGRLRPRWRVGLIAMGDADPAAEEKMAA